MPQRIDVDFRRVTLIEAARLLRSDTDKVRLLLAREDLADRIETGYDGVPCITHEVVDALERRIRNGPALVADLIKGLNDEEKQDIAAVAGLDLEAVNVSAGVALRFVTERDRRLFGLGGSKEPVLRDKE